MPYDPIGLAVAASAVVLVGLALTIGRGADRGGRLQLAVLLMVIAGAMLRVNGAWQFSLHEWDERFHAVVARHLVDDPFTPTLYQHPAVAYDLRDWTANHVWLHKPPLALWAMAASMAVFGIGELAMRLPSLLLSSLAVLLTFAIGRTLFTSRVGLLAAGVHALNGFLVALASGQRVADHVDTALVVLFELAILLGLSAARSGPAASACGVVIGLGALTKSLPALLALIVVFVAIGVASSWRRAFARTAAIGGIAVLVAAPWVISSHVRFPAEAAWESRYTLLHISERLEAATGGPFSYLADLPRFFGELSVLSLVLAAWWFARREPGTVVAGADGSHRRAPTVLAIWIAVPYGLFSIAATRMPAFVMVSAPAIFIVHAWVWWQILERGSSATPWRRRAATALLVLMALSPVRYLLEPTGVLERRTRRPAAFEELRQLDANLGSGSVVLFNFPLPIEAMFYSRHTAYPHLPSADDVRRILRAGRRVVIYRPPGEATTVPAEWPVSYLPGGILKR